MKHTSEFKSIYVSILLLGIVSLMGDIVYEGSRGLIPDYLKFLGATAFIVGLISGFGEFLGYAVRLVSGFLADTTRTYWVFMFMGYGLIASIPLLGFTNSWEIAAILVLLERLGKACRSPSRDTILSIVSRDVGTGKAFGIHEFLDQVGAVIGPLIVAALMFYSSNSYNWTFSLLIIPFTMLLIALAFTYWKIGSRIAVEPKTATARGRVLGRPFYIYTLAVILNTIGIIPASLILYKASIILQPERQQWMVPLIYLLIQGIDAPAALLSGYLYDRFSIKILILPFILSIFPPVFTMVNTDLTALIIASVFFGVVLGVQESTYRAAVSEFTPISSRGTAYGIFNAAYGIGFLISGGIYGLIIDLNIPLIVTLLFVVSIQTTALATLLKVYQKPREIKHSSVPIK
ncbi:MAG: MFS transporter [Candidatus Bathyarchaeia archaeon]